MQKHRQLHGITQGTDLRLVDTRHALTDAERHAIRRDLQRAALGLKDPRVFIGIAHGGIASLSAAILRNVPWGHSCAR